MESGLNLIAALLYAWAVWGLMRCAETGHRIDSDARRIAHNAALIRENAVFLSAVRHIEALGPNLNVVGSGCG